MTELSSLLSLYWLQCFQILQMSLLQELLYRYQLQVRYCLMSVAEE